MNETSTVWLPATIDMSSPSGNEVLTRLFEGSIPAAVVHDAVPQSILGRWTEIIESVRDDVNVEQYSNGALTSIGPYLMRRLNSTEQYFNEADAVGALFRGRGVPDPASVLQALLIQLLGLRQLSVATSSDGSKFAPAIVRIHDVGVSNPLHSDMASRDLPPSSIFSPVSRLRNQLSAVLCIRGCTKGGVLEIFRREWSPEAEVHAVENGLGYHRSVVEGADSWKLKPETGDLYVFHGARFHEITEVEGDTSRVTLGCFMAFEPDNNGTASMWA